MCGGHRLIHGGSHIMVGIPFSVPTENRNVSAIDVLKERLARGEIGVEEYQRIRSVLDPQYAAMHSPNIRKPSTV